MKKLFLFLILVALVVSSSLAIAPVKAQQNVTTIKIFIGKAEAYVNGTKTTLDQPPEIINSRTMVPIRFVSENMNATVDWNATTREVTIKLLNNTAILGIDKATAQANGYPVTLDSPATIVKATGRTIVPIRFVSDTLGADVTWNATERSVTIQFSSDWLTSPIEITFWHAMQAKLGESLTGLIAEFNATHPRIKVVPTAVANYTGLQQKTVAAISAGDPPLITQAYENWTAQYMMGSYLTPMQTYINGPNGFTKQNIQDFFPGMWQDGYMPDGKFWMLPFNKSTEVMFYNVDMLKAAGYDHPPKSWTEFAQICEKLTKEDGSQWGASMGSDVDLWYAMAYEWGGKVLSDDYSKVLFDKDQNTIASVSFLNDLYKNGSVHFTTGYDYQTDFGAGKCAFIFSSIAGYTYIDKAVGGKFKWAEAVIPSGPVAQYGVMYGTNVVIFGAKYSQAQQNAAWEFVKWFTNTDQTAKWAAETGYLPVRKSALNVPILKSFINDHPELKAGYDQLPNCLAEPPTNQWNRARTDIANELSKIFLQKISPEDGMKELGQMVRSYIGG